MSYFKESGFLSKEGEALTVNFKGSINVLFDSLEVQDLTEDELRLLGSNMANMVGDKVAQYIARKKQNTNKYSEMSDSQFEEYLKEKYGSHWMLVTLSEEELTRCTPLSKEEIKKAIEEGMRDSQPGLYAIQIDSNKGFYEK